jgi:hypothetical protein
MQIDLFHGIKENVIENGKTIQLIKKTRVDLTAPLTPKEDPYKDFTGEKTKSVPVVAIYPNRIMSYNEILDRSWTRSLAGIQSLPGVEGDSKPVNDHKGNISGAAKKRILNAVNWLYYLSKKKTVVKSHSMYQFRVNFITLTLAGAQKHSDQYIKNELLNEFLEWLRTKHGVKSYIWKAEPQKNGNIHFHVTTNVYIDHAGLREKWNRIQQKHGYLDEYHDKFKDLSLVKYVELLRTEGNCKDFKDLKRAYEIGCADNWMNPNSTDVHSTKKVRKMAGYMAKYMTKESEVFLFKFVKDVEKEADKDIFFKDRDKKTDLYDEKTGLTRVFVHRKIKGRQWFLSLSLSRIKAPVLIYDSELNESFGVLSRLKSSFFKAYDFASVLYYDYKEALFNKCNAFLDELIQLSFNKSVEINPG